MHFDRRNRFNRAKIKAIYSCSTLQRQQWTVRLSYLRMPRFITVSILFNWATWRKYLDVSSDPPVRCDRLLFKWMRGPGETNISFELWKTIPWLRVSSILHNKSIRKFNHYSQPSLVKWFIWHAVPSCVNWRYSSCTLSCLCSSETAKDDRWTF